ncbi:MAG: DUF6455 family protein [Rhodobacter sp.]|nr:DUF6455 family protein [Rhodobacter sp.]
MSFLEKIERHADLFRRMADTVEADLGEAAMEGRLTEAALRSAIVSCVGCKDAEACGDWLDAQSEGAAKTPGYCRNTALFERLAAG